MFSKPAQQSGLTAGGGILHPQDGHGFGTAPVFLTSICTILGAILFLRFGYAVGHVGLWGSLAIIALGHLVTIPTVLAVSESDDCRDVPKGDVTQCMTEAEERDWFPDGSEQGQQNRCDAQHVPELGRKTTNASTQTR